ncbi:MAG: alpha/beta hydrolase [Planctomycetota bacterium]
MSIIDRIFITTSSLLLLSISCSNPHDAMASDPQVIPLWKNGAPGFENRRDEPETAQDWWVANVHQPSLTVFKPEKTKANGTALVIVPGGGHRKLVFDAEGTEPAKLLRDQGVTVFVLKHRLAREEGSPYQIEVHAKQDGQRAMQVVRERAEEFGIDPERVGMLGFSAGGEVVSMVTYDSTHPEMRPDFQMLVYPGPLGIPDSFPGTLPPAFLLVAADDGAVRNIMMLTDAYLKQKASVEVHVYAAGGHGFNLGRRSDLKSIQTWPQRMVDWMGDQGFLGDQSPPKAVGS